MSVQKRIINRICATNTLSALLSAVFIINTILVAASLQFLLYVNKEGFYEDSGQRLQNSIVEEMMKNSGHNALLYFHYHLLNIYSEDTQNASLAAYRDMFSEEISNFFFKITDTSKVENKVIFSNFDSESRKDYYPDSAEFFNSGENIALLRSTDTLNFEGHLKKDMTADDAYSRLDGLFGFINAVKYFLAVFTVFMLILELLLGYLVVRCAGHKNGRDTLTESEIDRIPAYIIAIFYIPAFTVGTFFFNKNFMQLCDWMAYASGKDISASLYKVILLLLFLAACLKTLLSTVAVRIKSPRQHHGSFIYRLVGLRKNVQAVIGIIIVAVVCELAVFMLSGILGGGSLKWLAVCAEVAVTLFVCYIIFFVERNTRVWIRGTRKIAINKKGSIPLQDITGSHRLHAENINFLSKSASAQTEKRFINESFSTQLINGVSNSIRTPLSKVLENVEELKSDSLDKYDQNRCIEEIDKLSADLKKTIEDIILISKATTGNIEINADYTDLGVFLSQIIGEYYGMFKKKNITVAEERDENPVIVNADPQFMWYVFDGVLSSVCRESLYGTSVHIRIKRVDEKAVLVFRTCVKPSERDDNMLTEGDLGLPTAKVFSELQGGDVHFSCKKDIMTVVLRFPLARIGNQKNGVDTQ